MGSPTDQQMAVYNETTVKRQKQIATLNADTMNIPKKIQFSFHLVTFIIGVIQILVAYLIYSMLYSEEESTFTKRDLITSNLKTFQIQHSTWNIIIASVVYLVLCISSYFATDLKTYFQNAKNVRELNNCYDKIRNSGVSLTFEIQCYHYEQRNKKSSKTKVFTHKATKTINFSQCYDLSGFLKPQVQKQFKKNFAFIEYKASYEFLEKQQEATMNSMYEQFVSINKRDTNQDHKKTFKFTDCQSSTQQAYLLKGENATMNPLLLFSSFVCFTWPVALAIQLLYIERYEVTILKKVKLDQTQQGYKKVAE